MTRRRAFVRGLLAGMLVMLASDALRWILSPAMHPSASSLRHGLAAAQGVLALLGAIMLARNIPREGEEVA